MTPHYERLLPAVDAFACRLLRRGWHPEDIAAAIFVEGVALSRAVNGDADTVRTLDEVADYIDAEG